MFRGKKKVVQLLFGMHFHRVHTAHRLHRVHKPSKVVGGDQNRFLRTNFKTTFLSLEAGK